MDKLFNKKDIIWNTLGSILNAVVSFVLAIFVIKIIGSNEGGIFSFGYSTLSQIALIISFFGIRPFHIVDIHFNYRFNDYYSHRIITSLISSVSVSLYIILMYVFGKYSLYKSIVLIIIIQSGVLEGFADSFDCEFQRNNKLYISGQAIFFRALIYSFSLIFTICITKNLLVSVFVASVFKIIIVFYLSLYRYRHNFINSFKFDLSRFKDLTKETYSLFLIAIIDVIIFSMPKLLIDYIYGDVYSGLFNLYFMPVNGIYLLMNLIIKPLLTPISNLYHYDKKKYNDVFNRIIIICISLCVLVLLTSVVLSNYYKFFINYLTNHIYENVSVDINKIFVLNMFGGTIYSMTTPIYYILVISNKQKNIMIIYLLSLICSFFIGPICFNIFSFLGASIMFVVNNIIILVSLLLLKYKNG